jgi:hypothetical protein
MAVPPKLLASLVGSTLYIIQPKGEYFIKGNNVIFGLGDGK